MPDVDFLDTSALGRAFGEDQAAEWVAGRIRAGVAVMSLLGLTEARGIVNTKLRRGMTLSEAEHLWRLIRGALDLVSITPLDRQDFESAQELLVSATDLKASDALHLVAARRLADAGVGVTFVTADRRQAAVAERMLDAVRVVA